MQLNKKLLSWFGLDKCQVPTKTALSLPLLSWTGERKHDEKLKGRDKTGRDHSPITVTELGEKSEFNSSPIKTEWENKK